MSSTISAGGQPVLNVGSLGVNYPNTISANSGPYTFANGTNSITQNPWATESTMNAGKLNLNGDNADLVINGKSLTDTLIKIEERLSILAVNEKLEEEWAELKELGTKYRELESQIKAKMATYEALKRYEPS